MTNPQNITPMTTPTSTMTEVKTTMQTVTFCIRFNEEQNPVIVHWFCVARGLPDIAGMESYENGIWETERGSCSVADITSLLAELNTNPIVQKAWIRQH